MSLNDSLAHPYERLRRCASASFFRECISASDAGDDGVSRFRSRAEEALDYCHHRTIRPLRPTARDTLTHWLVDWGPIIRMMRWHDLILDHDHKNNDLDASALTEACLVVRDVVWKEHRRRLIRLGQFYGIQRPKQGDRPEERSDWEIMIDQFHDAQLRLMQKIFLDVWTDRQVRETRDHCHHDAMASVASVGANPQNETAPVLAQSDRFLFDFVSAQLTGPFLQPALSLMDESSHSFPRKTNSTVIWSNIIRQYTESLCNDIQSLLEPSKLDPILAILQSKQHVRGHDIHTRTTMFLMLVSRIRTWADLLVGLQKEDIVDESAPNEKSEVMHSGEGDAFPLVGETLARLFGRMECAGALCLLTPEEHHRASAADLSPLDRIRLIDASLQAGNWRNLFFPKQTGRNAKAKKENKRFSDNSHTEPPCNEKRSGVQSLESMSLKSSSLSATCIMKKCRDKGKLSYGGMCRHHRKRFNQPHPFNWEDVIPEDMQIQIMKRLRRRGIGPNGNVHNAIIQEVARMKQQRAKSSSKVKSRHDRCQKDKSSRSLKK